VTRKPGIITHARSRSRAERLLVALGVDPGFAEAVLGDLAEEYAQRLTRDGTGRAMAWYTREAIRSTPHLLWSGVARMYRYERGRFIAYVAGATVVATLAMAALHFADGPPVRIVGGISGAGDTLVINNVRPVQLPIRVLDARGHVLESNGVRYRWTSGLRVPVSDSGVVTCAGRGDAMVRASLGAIATTVLVRCRPVEKIYLEAGLELVAGDSAEPIPFEAVDSAGRRVELLAGSMRILDTTVAKLEGGRVRPRAPGSTLVGVFVGDRGEWTGVNVYERVSSPSRIRPDENVAVPVRLASGDTRRWPLPAGSYVISMQPEGSALRFALLNGACARIPFVRAYLCGVRADASIIVYNRWEQDATPAVGANLMLRRLADETP